MIEFKFSNKEIKELSQTVPNFEVILKALIEHPKIELVRDEDDHAV